MQHGSATGCRSIISCGALSPQVGRYYLVGLFVALAGRSPFGRSGVQAQTGVTGEISRCPSDPYEDTGRIAHRAGCDVRREPGAGPIWTSAIVSAVAGAVGVVFALTPAAEARFMHQRCVRYEAAPKAGCRDRRPPPRRITLGIGDVVSATIFEPPWWTVRPKRRRRAPWQLRDTAEPNSGLQR